MKFGINLPHVGRKAGAAAATKRVGLGTSVPVLGLRHTVQLARELATLDLLSGGRLVLGAGVGWLAAEFAALGVPFEERGVRADETIRMLRACWSETPVAYRPAVIPATMTDMRTLPQPDRKIPIWVAGNWRIVFRFDGVDARDVDLIDYH